jgi:hypothetical protein
MVCVQFSWYFNYDTTNPAVYHWGNYGIYWLNKSKPSLLVDE